jgi:ubiquinone biosynthesis accessory factor UbiJ
MSNAPIFPSLPNLPLPTPPEWLMRELRQRVVLLLNHVLQQEPEAMARLARKKGQIVFMEYAQFAISLIATPAGLLDLAPEDAVPDLTIRVQGDNPLALLQTLLSGDKPRMDISGDVMLAAEVNWLVDHVRWDIEEDLARIMGDVPAHSLMRVLRGAGDVLRKFAANAPFNSAGKPSEQGDA